MSTTRGVGGGSLSTLGLRRAQEESKRLTEADLVGYLCAERCVREWIETNLRITLSHPTDLKTSLHNGIVLCYLSQHVDPRSIPAIQESTSSRHRLCENVYFFIEALSEFGVPNHLLFRSSDLLDADTYPGSVPRLVYCLDFWARKLAGRIYLQNFPEGNSYVEIRESSTFEKESREFLSKMDKRDVEGLRVSVAAGKPPMVRECRGPMRVSSVVMRTQLALFAGGENKIKMDRVEKGFVRVQAMWRGFAARRMYKKRVRDAAYRQKVAAELLQTELDYVSNLEVCIKVFKRPMEEWARRERVVPPEEIATIFSDIEIIAQFNAKLRDELAPFMANWSLQSCLSKPFNSMIGFLPLYTNYVVNYDTSLMMLGHHRKNRQFEAFLQTCRESPENVKLLDLAGYLIQPIQRGPRYLLLLTEIVKHTWSTHKDYQGLCVAMESVRRLTTMLNEKKREGENLMEIVAIDRRLSSRPKDFVLIEPSRRLVKECRGKGETTVILFTDIVLVAKGHEKLRYSAHLPLVEGDLCPSSTHPEEFEVVKFGEKKALCKVTMATQAERGEFLEQARVVTAELKAKMKKKAEFQERMHRSDTVDDGQQESSRKTAEATLRDRALRKKVVEGRGGAKERLESLQAQRALIVSQMDDLNGTIQATERKKDRETVSRAKAVLSSLQDDLEKKDEEIAKAQSDESSPSPAPANTPPLPSNSPGSSPTVGRRPGSTVGAYATLRAPSTPSSSLRTSSPSTAPQQGPVSALRERRASLGNVQQPRVIAGVVIPGDAPESNRRSPGSNLAAGGTDAPEGNVSTSPTQSAHVRLVVKQPPSGLSAIPRRASEEGDNTQSCSGDRKKALARTRRYSAIPLPSDVSSALDCSSAAGAPATAPVTVAGQSPEVSRSEKRRSGSFLSMISSVFTSKDQPAKFALSQPCSPSSTPPPSPPIVPSPASSSTTPVAEPRRNSNPAPVPAPPPTLKH